jgi:nitrite reductase/ring-hydroxylating ferredoxin subunit
MPPASAGHARRREDGAGVMDGRQLAPLCAAAEIPPGSAARAELRGKAYAVFNLGGRFYVTQDQCTHGPGTLSDGFVEGEEIECPFHGGRFHIPSGKPSGAPCTEPLACWPAEIVDGRVCIDPTQRG